MRNRKCETGATPVLLTLLAFMALPADALDLRQAVVVSAPDATPRQQRAVRMLVEEGEKRTGIRWPQMTAWPTTNAPVIAVGLVASLRNFAGPHADSLPSAPGAAEGFRLVVRQSDKNPAVLILGNDERGVLFGVGRLLRELRMERGKASLPEDLDVTTAPRYPLRGHQLGYRPKTHSYDAWDLPVWEQYFRDLAVFGCNAIELIPPRSDDAADSPHFPRPPMEMMQGMSRLADEYGLDVWIWYPAMDKDYADPQTVEFALREWAEVFSKLPRIDAVFVPGGDPGHTQPKYLMALLEKQTQSLHRYHPKAQMWLSPQGFDQTWMDEFLDMLKRDQPDWLSGIVFGPQVRVDVPELRKLVPAKYPIRHYPDITHSRQCQYPVHDWDTAFAVTEARECINPRPEAEAIIARKTLPDTIGFLTYSEGCNDDVNKIVWSALGWNPDEDVMEILRQYSRYFIGVRYTDDFARGLLALERNWHGPLAANENVETTLVQIQALEQAASPADLKNWRFQQALFRAYYDAHVRRRLSRESRLEESAMRQMRAAVPSGSITAMAAAEKVLDQAAASPQEEELRVRIHELAAALFQSISMQLSVKKYKAIAVDRGACLDTLDFPLNNGPWLKHRFAAIRQLSSEAERLQAIEEILSWTDPGPGGFYDDVGNVARQPHLVQTPGFEEDPSRMRSVRVDFEEEPVWGALDVPRRVSWMDHAESLYDEPLRMQYTGLDPKARYTLRVVYAGDNTRRKMRLVANETTEIHPYITRPVPFKPMEFDLPPATTASGELNLTWFGEIGLGGNGRNCQVSEVWLLKRPASAGQ